MFVESETPDAHQGSNGFLCIMKIHKKSGAAYKYIPSEDRMLLDMKSPWHSSSQSALAAGSQDVSPATAEVNTPGDGATANKTRKCYNFLTVIKWDMTSQRKATYRQGLQCKMDKRQCPVSGENLGSLLVYASQLLQQGRIADHASTLSFYTVSQGGWFESNPWNLVCFLVINPVWKTSTSEISNIRSRG